jgi:glutathione synthase/RimK-type ligase-like ATP-grasp enzyme
MDVDRIKENPTVRTIRHSMFYCRFRRLVFGPGRQPLVDDRGWIGKDASPVLLHWPPDTPKPQVGVIQDYGVAPRWTKYYRFLETNAIPHALYDIHARNWRTEASKYDVIVGVDSSELSRLDELRKKYYVLERHMHRKCYPGYEDLLLYEDKILEFYLSDTFGLPLVPTYVYHCREEALAAADRFAYPIVSKVVPGSGSVGVQLVKNRPQCRAIIRRAFSAGGRGTHYPYAAQKDYVYFQDYVPNDGYDVRVIVTGTRMCGFYRKVPAGDFRASGMHVEETRALPDQALRTARRAYDIFKSPMLVVDMLKNLKGEYLIIEISPLCRIDTCEELKVQGIPGYYVMQGDSYSFQPGRLWVPELALKEFFSREYGIPPDDPGADHRPAGSG